MVLVQQFRQNTS